MERGEVVQYHEGEFGGGGVGGGIPEGVDLVGVGVMGDKHHQQQKQLMNKKGHQHSPHHSHPHNHPHPPSWKGALKLVVINMFVCTLVLGYALLGSFVFLALENNNGGVGQGKGSSSSGVLASTASIIRRNFSSAVLNNLDSEQIQQLKRDTVKNIWDITLSMNILYPDNWTKMTNEEVNNFQRFLLEKLITAVENVTAVGGYAGAMGHESPPYPWTFPRAFLFALTTLTTIGYGGIGPKTSSGKIATMVYAVFGIPIMLWYLSNVGSLLAKIARFLCIRVCCCCGCCCHGNQGRGRGRGRGGRGGNPGGGSSSTTRKVSDNPSTYHYSLQQNNKQQLQTYQGEEEVGVSICVIFTLCLLVLLGYVCLGSYILSRWQHWQFLDSFYFCFLTLTTISFGDSRAQRTGRLDQFSERTEWFCSFYILFGMALTSMFFNILHEEISLRFKRWKTHQPSNNSSGAGDPLAEGGVNKDPTSNNLQQIHARNRPLENSYSVHFMNFSNPSSPPPHVGGGGGHHQQGTPRNFTEETLLSNSSNTSEVHHHQHNKGVGGYLEDDGMATMGEGVGGGDPYGSLTHSHTNNPREMYSPHPVFPR